MTHYRMEEHLATCPYCGEPVNLLVDLSAEEQDYIEDCEVCCRPIQIRVRLDGEKFNVSLHQENDVI